MKKLTLLMALCLLGMFAFAQNGRQASTNTPKGENVLVVKAAGDETFVVSLNGKKQNRKAQNLVEVKGLAQGEYAIEVALVSPKVKNKKATMNIALNAPIMELAVSVNNGKVVLNNVTKCDTGKGCGKHAGCNHSCGGHAQQGCSDHGKAVQRDHDKSTSKGQDKKSR